MEHKVFTTSFDKIIKQRNFFVVLSCLLLLSTVFLSIALSQKNTTVVMVPGLEAEMSISNTKVSKSYLEQNSHMFLSCLLDLTPNTVRYKSELVLKNTTSKGARDIENYFNDQAKNLSKFKISTYFTPKYLQINEKTLEVKASGILTSFVGNEGTKHQEIEVLLTFEYKGGFLKLDKFLPATSKGN